MRMSLSADDDVGHGIKHDERTKYQRRMCDVGQNAHDCEMTSDWIEPTNQITQHVQY